MFTLLLSVLTTTLQDNISNKYISHSKSSTFSDETIDVNDTSNGYLLKINVLEKDLDIKKSENGFIIKYQEKSENENQKLGNFFEVKIKSLENEIQNYEINQVNDKTEIKFNFVDSTKPAKIVRTIKSISEADFENKN